MVRARSRRNVDSTGREQVVLSLDSSSPFGHRQTAVGAPNLFLSPGASRQRWEQGSWSQGLDMAGWERGCITWRGKHGAELNMPLRQWMEGLSMIGVKLTNYFIYY